MAGTNQGIIEPPIDSLLEKVDSKYQLVIFASKRARQINDYYSDLHEGNLFDNVGPLVDSTVEDKPLTIALHEIHEDKLRLRHRRVDPAPTLTPPTRVTPRGRGTGGVARSGHTGARPAPDSGDIDDRAASVHVRVRHRGAPRQDLRPDLGQHPRRDPRG